MDKLIVLSGVSRLALDRSAKAKDAYMEAAPGTDAFQAAKSAWMDAMLVAINAVEFDAAHGCDAASAPDPCIGLMYEIDLERSRLGMSLRMPVRVGVRGGAPFAALSSHPDSPFTEGACTGLSMIGALTSLRDRMRACDRVACPCGSSRECTRCLGVGHTTEVRP